NVRLVAGIDERSAIHGVDADYDAEEICALRNLIKARLTRRAFAFHAHFAGAGENLAGNQKRHDRADDSVPRTFPPRQVLILATVAVPEKVGVVFVKANLLA